MKKQQSERKSKIRYSTIRTKIRSSQRNTDTNAQLETSTAIHAEKENNFAKKLKFNKIPKTDNVVADEEKTNFNDSASKPEY